MDKLKYLAQYLIILTFFLIFKIIGLRLSYLVSGYLATLIGPLIKSKKIISANIDRAIPNIEHKEKSELIKKMWINYGKILADYVFIKNYRLDSKFQKKILLVNENVLQKIKKDKVPVIFISGHFNNFELMAMYIEKYGIDLSAIYRPLNNKFLNPVMENIRKKYLCKNQIEKGLPGTKKILKQFKNNISIALMIDQRVSEGIKCPFFGQNALTTTLPAQFVKKYNVKIVPVYIERLKNNDFKLEFYESIAFSKNENIYNITLKLNNILEKMILKNPEQWIWTHNRWK
jgi:KDO2-lipid IV(A) lauroyltransferase